MTLRLRQHLRRASSIGLVLLWLLVGCEAERIPSPDEIRAFQAEGRFEETILPLRKHLEESPDDIELNRLLGLALLAADSPSTAVWTLRRVTEHPEHSVNDLYALAQAYARSGAHEYGLAECERVLTLEPDHPGALLMHMNLASTLERWDDVVDSADRILKHDSTLPQAHHAQAEAFVALERLDEATEAIALARASAGRGAQDPSLETSFCLLELTIAEKLEQSEQIEDHLDECLARTRGSEELIDYAISLYDGRNERDRATSLLERTLAAAPRHFELRRRLADRLDAEGRSDDAQALLLEATELEGASFQAWLLVAAFHREREDHAAAARAVENVLLARDNVPALLMAEYGDDLVRAGEFDKAEEVIGRIERPEWAALLRGRLLLEQGDAAAAMEQLQEGIRLWPGNGAARLLAGRAAERLGHFDQAILEYRNAVRSDLEGTSAVFELAGLHEAEGIYLAAYFPLNVRLQRKPGDARAGLDLVRIALAGQNVPLASTTATSLGANGEAVAELLARAMIAEDTEGPDAAAETLIASDLDCKQPADFKVLEALVGYLVEAGREAEAVSRARKAVEQNPSSPALHSLHASALRAKGRDTSAREAYQRSLALDPENAQALAGLALLEAEAGDHAEATLLYDQSAVADPDDPAAAWAAILLAVDTESESAVDARLEALLYTHPRHAQAANLLASRLFERGTDLERADELSRRAIRFRGGAQAFETGGRIALSQGDSARALGLLLRALELRPDSPGTRYQLALALIEADRPDAARKALEAALDAGEFDQSAQAREALARLTLDTGASDE